MKRMLALILCAVLILGLGACSGKNPAASTQPGENTPSGGGPHTTLMVYMVGSDLEAKGGAGTKDMEEMLASQVDLTGANVLVYAGGSKKWHNDQVSREAGHTLLQMTPEGFQTLQTREEVSMGEADTLAYFLNYGYTNFPAQNYALILWDHGNGPLIGYGKDMLHDDDSLTLLEMKTSLEASPFKGEQKLSWVGFDACLMSSVELACTWQDHADYMIASQEIEPSFGWNYAFLQDLGKAGPEDMADVITRQYMDTCLAYYEDRGYDQRDTTIACMNLSKLEPLKNALNALFQKAAQDVNTSYAQLVNSRVNSRALGRATTGSEYDLVDICHMAQQMKDQYPEEAAAIEQAVTEMVVHNVNNTADCCGMSLYYPFYNKSYYEKTWGDVYSQLDAIPAYVDYLEAYAGQWLKNDLLQSVASSRAPQIATENTFTLELTQEQADTYAQAGYYILKREGEQIYTTIYSSHNVTKNGNTLTANFDGNILYAKNDLGTYWIPVITEHDTVGDYTRYSTYVNLTNMRPVFGDEPEGFEQQTLGHRFHISVNNKTKEIKTSALVPYTETVDVSALIGGKKEDADLSQWSQYYFLHGRHLYLQRDKNNTILPLSQWIKSSYLSANVSRVGDGIQFLFAPISAGEYYLIFEIQDVQGNSYCSELLTIQGQNVEFPSEVKNDQVSVTWQEGETVKLFTQGGVTIHLGTIEKYDGSVTYTLIAENSNNFDVVVQMNYMFVNDYIDCSDGYFSSYVVPAGETMAGSGIDFGDMQLMGMMKDHKSLQLYVDILTASGDRTLAKEKLVDIQLSEAVSGLYRDPDPDALFGASYYTNTQPVCGLLATEQLIFQEDGMKVTLLGMGGNGERNSDMIFAFRLENSADTEQTIRIDGLHLDQVTLNDSTGPITLYPGTVIYRYYVVSYDDLQLHQITSAASMSIQITRMENATLTGGGGFSTTKAYPVTLAQKGTAVQFQAGSQVLYEDSQVCITLLKQQKRKYGGYEWICTMTNKGSRTITLDTGKVLANGAVVNLDDFGCPVLAPYDIRCGAGESTVFDVTYTSEGAVTLLLTPQFYDENVEELLWTGNTQIELKTQ